MGLLNKDGTPVRPPKIVILVPSHDLCPVTFAADLAQMYMTTAQALQEGVNLGLFVLPGTYIHSARQSLLEGAIAEGATHVLFLDSDMRIPPDALINLLAHNKQMVGINYSQRFSPPDFVAIKKADYEGSKSEKLVTDDESTGLEEVDAIGFGCVLIRCDALQSLPKKDPWFFFEWSSKHRRQQVGEDVWFCRLVKKVGVTIYVDHDLSKRCRHIGSFEYTTAHPLAYKDALAALAEQAA